MSTVAAPKKAPSTKPPSRPTGKRSAWLAFFDWIYWNPANALCVGLSASILLHALIAAFLGLLLPWLSDLLPSAIAPPPKMDEVEIEGQSGGGDALGESLSKLGKGNQPGLTEGVGSGPTTAQLNPQQILNDNVKLLDVQAKLNLYPPTDSNDYDRQQEVIFANLAKASGMSAEDLKRALDSPPVEIGPPGSKKGSSNVPGAGSVGGSGKGIGKGQGAGVGQSPTGRIATKQQRRSSRWQLVPSGDGPTHIKKLAALNITLAIPKGRGGEYVFYDLSNYDGTAASLKISDLSAQTGKIRWFMRPNLTPPNDVRLAARQAEENKAIYQRLAALKEALNLKEVPPFAAIYLPRQLEERMAEIEEAHNGRREEEIELTFWDVNSHNGIFDNEPVIKDQILRGQRR